MGTGVCRLVVSMIGAAILASAPSAAQQPLPRPPSITQRLSSGTQPATFVLELEEPSTVAVYAKTRRAPGLSKAEAEAQARSRAQSQLSRVEAQQAALERSLAGLGSNVRVLFRLQRTLNGVAVLAEPNMVPRLRRLPGVKAVHRLVPMRPTNETSVPFIGGGTAWSWPGSGYAGSGIRIGIIDTGIDYFHGDFGGSGNPAHYDANNPDIIGDGGFPTAKVVGGWDFVGDDYNADHASTSIPAPDPDPVDAYGHGTHVAGTAAGVGVLQNGSAYAGPYHAGLDMSQFRIGPGVAPEAKLYALKVFGRTGTTTFATNAIEWAIDPNGDGDFSDRLDVINLSLGSVFGSADGVTSQVCSAAAEVGVVVVGSAGNSGDTFYVTGGAAAAETAIGVANSVDGGLSYPAVEVSDPPEIAAFYAASPAAFGPALTETGITAELVYGIPADGCNPYPAGAFAGKIALIDRGTCNFVLKVRHAQNAGAIAVVFVNNVEGPPITPGDDGTGGDITIPSVMVSIEDGEILKTALSSGTVTATLSSAVVLTRYEQADTLNGSSSRGPRVDVRNILKPDVAAPGTDIASAGMGTGNQAEFLSGTSMAAPHVAGMMALLRQAHPDWSVAELKALAMNTALHDLFTGDNQTPPRYGLSRIGAGRVDLEAALKGQALAFDLEAPQRVSVSFQTREVLGQASETRTVRIVNKGSSPLAYALVLDTVTDIPGVSYSLPAVADVELAPGASADVPVLLEADATLMKHTHDESLDEYPFDTPRHWMSEEAAYLQFVPKGDEPPLRVPLYAALRPASDLRAATPTLDLDESVTQFETLELELQGIGFDNGDLYPYDEEPFVTPLELQIVSMNEPESSGLANAGDIRFVGVATDLSPEVSQEFASVFFGIATYGDWPTLSSATFTVYIDTNRDGQEDFALYTTDDGTYFGGDPTDALITSLYRYSDDVELYQGPVNYLYPDEANTAPFGTNVVVLQLWMSDLELASPFIGFDYWVDCGMYLGGDFETVDATTKATFVPGNPALRFHSPDWGTLIRPSYDGYLLPYSVNTTSAWFQRSYGALLLHHLNRKGARAEAVPFAGPAFPDSDSDLLTDLHEPGHGTSTAIADSDGDGLRDGEEVFIFGTDPMADDTDGDGLTDGWEALRQLDPSDSTGDEGASGDPDGDGLTNAEEFAAGSHPRNEDSDADGLPDGEEVNAYGTNPGKADTDGDGLDDGEEVNVHGTSPVDDDTDGGGVDDGKEISLGTDPLNPEDDKHPADLNGDAALNAADVQLAVNAVLRLPVPPGTNADINNDGLLNASDVQLAVNAVLGLF